MTYGVAWQQTLFVFAEMCFSLLLLLFILPAVLLSVINFILNIRLCASCVYILTVESFIAGLTDCEYYKTDEYNYTHFVELNAIKDAQPTGLYARVPVYVIGARDAHIILSTTDKPNRDKDFVYEFCKCDFFFSSKLVYISINGSTCWWHAYNLFIICVKFSTQNT